MTVLQVDNGCKYCKGKASVNKDIDYNLIARFLAGECTEKEKEVFKSWVNNDPDRKAMMESFQYIWNSGNRSQPWDVEMAWDRVSKQMNTDKTDRSLTKLKKTYYLNTRNSRKPLRTILRIAAAFLIVGFASLYFVQMEDDGSQQATDNVFEQVVTERGERAQVQLDDGSRIHLSVDSKLQQPREFSNTDRTVHLNGEAYFEIAHDDRPFFVHTKHAVVQIYGTEFNVQAYDNEQVQVVVADGKVGVRSPMISEADNVILVKGDMAQIDRNSGEIVLKRGVDLQHYLGWFNYKLVFNDAPLKEVVKKLERWYDIDITMTDTELYDVKFTAEFENEPIVEVLDIMKYSLQLKYNTKGKEVTFFTN